MVGNGQGVEAEEAPNPSEVDSKGTKEPQTRERSSIEFPYGDLNDAVAIALAIHQNAGVSCSLDQLAGYMRQSATSGAFRQDLSTARVFGLVETERGSISLTTLGRRIVDSAQERPARADAFLTVPLYRAIFDRHRGHALPPTAALEREIAELGVAQKQKGRARQAFDRSAEQAGFFEHGRDRLVAPAGTGRAPDEGSIQDIRDDSPSGGRGSGNAPPPPPPPSNSLHPFIQGLLKTLPEPETEWDGPARAKWLQTAANIFDLIYKGEGGIEIKSAIAPRSPRPD